MKKSLLSVSLLTTALALNAQDNVLMHVDDAGKMFISANTLVYSGGGVQTKASGLIENHGNIMIVGGANDVVRTLASDNSPKVNGSNIILKINDSDPGDAITSGYGQLYISGIPQNKVTAVVDKEYVATKHGAYQQIGFPFYNKTFSEISTELGAGFDIKRWYGKEILKWNNQYMRYDGSVIPTSQISTANHPGITIALTDKPQKGGYYAVGTGGGFNPEAIKTIKGVPFADGNGSGTIFNLTPSNVNYGTNGASLNIYREKYNTYVTDVFDAATPWTGTFGKYVYQYSNPYLTNIDLSGVGYTESTINDGNTISNIRGIIANPSNVKYNNGTTGDVAEAQKVTFDANGKPTGNFNALVVRPLGTFVVKLRNSTSGTLNFDNLRRFNYTPRAEGVNYSVTAAKNGGASGAIKQLGVIALDANGNQIGETYYVVAPHFSTGYIPNQSIASVQATTSTTSSIIHTFEEDPTVGGIDTNYQSAYRLYINEANETDFLGKKVSMGIYSPNIASLKFEIREDARLITDGVHALSTGTGFYYTSANGQAVQIKQGDIIPVSGNSYGLYYGQPAPNGSLNTTETVVSSRTLITYNPAVENYIVRFDPKWKSASIEVYDMSGRIVISEKSVGTTADYVINLDGKVKSAYMVKVTGNDGSVVNGKIVTK